MGQQALVRGGTLTDLTALIHSIQEMLTGQRLCHSESHNDSVLAALNQQRSDGILCDVTLIAEEQKFHAHKAVLAACSDYFRVSHSYLFSLLRFQSKWRTLKFPEVSCGRQPIKR